jgi:hypothetical protein
MYFYIVSFYPTYLFSIINLMIYNTINSLMHDKMQYSRSIVSMMCPSMSNLYRNDLGLELPQLNMYDCDNLNNLITLSMVLTKVNQSLYLRCVIQFSAVSLVSILMVLYICFMNQVLEMELFEIGSFEFIIYCFYQFFVLMGYFLIVMLYGSEANSNDHKIK